MKKHELRRIQDKPRVGVKDDIQFNNEHDPYDSSLSQVDQLVKEVYRRKRYHLQYPIRFISRLAMFIGLFFIVFIAVKSITEKADRIHELPRPSAVIIPVTEITTSSAKPEPIQDVVPEGFIRKPLLVVLDAGHGGRDPGTVAPQDETVLEKDITLKVAKMCEQYLKMEGIPVLMTRNEDVALDDTVAGDLKKRVSIANDAEATIFVSIHINSLDLNERGAKDVNGVECYYAEKEQVFSPLTDKLLAERLIDSVVAENNNLSKGVMMKRYSVLAGARMPAALLEIGYISHSGDFVKLTSDSYLDQTAKGIAQAIMICVEQMNPKKIEDSYYVLQSIAIPPEDIHE